MESVNSRLESEDFNFRMMSLNHMRSDPSLASSASSVASGNWRSSMLTTSSAATSTSAFTRYSNSSARSVSTTATSVSSSSWRSGAKSGTQSPPLKQSMGPPTTLPRNVKCKYIFSSHSSHHLTHVLDIFLVMTGVPYELGEAPRGIHPSASLDNMSSKFYGSPPPANQRGRKSKNPNLGTINERPTMNSFLSNGSKNNDQRRKDASTSTDDLGDHGPSSDDLGSGRKKMQKGQINALGKMLSALRR